MKHLIKFLFGKKTYIKIFEFQEDVPRSVREESINHWLKVTEVKVINIK